LALADIDDCSYKKALCVNMGNNRIVDYSLSQDGFNPHFGKFVAVKMILLALGAVALSAYGGYLYGKSQAKTQIVEKQVEIIKYVAQKRAKIQAHPNASRAELIELMRKGEL